MITMALMFSRPGPRSPPSIPPRRPSATPSVTPPAKARAKELEAAEDRSRQAPDHDEEEQHAVELDATAGEDAGEPRHPPGHRPDPDHVDTERDPHRRGRRWIIVDGAHEHAEAGHAHQEGGHQHHRDAGEEGADLRVGDEGELEVEPALPERRRRADVVLRDDRVDPREQQQGHGEGEDHDQPLGAVREFQVRVAEEGSQHAADEHSSDEGDHQWRSPLRGHPPVHGGPEGGDARLAKVDHLADAVRGHHSEGHQPVDGPQRDSDDQGG